MTTASASELRSSLTWLATDSSPFSKSTEPAIVPPRCSQVCWKAEQSGLAVDDRGVAEEERVLEPAAVQERGGGARLAEQARVGAEGEAAGRRRPEAGLVGDRKFSLSCSSASGAAGGRGQRLAAEDEHVGALFDHLLNRQHGLLGVGAGVGLDHPASCGRRSHPWRWFPRPAVRPRRRWRHRAPCSRSWRSRRRSLFPSAGPWRERWRNRRCCRNRPAGSGRGRARRKASAEYLEIT